MSQEQEPQINMPLTTEAEPASIVKMNPASAEIKVQLKPPLVSEEELDRMHAQIAGAFENSAHLPEKSGEWKAETGMGRQAAKVAWFGFTHPLLTGKGFLAAFKNRKPRSQEKSINSQDATPQF